MKHSYFRKLWTDLKKSLHEIDRSIFVVALHDAAFWVISIFAFLGWSLLVRWKNATVQFNPPTFDATNAAMVNIAVQSMTDFLIFTFVTLFALLVVGVLAYSFFEGLVWLKTMRKRFNWLFFRRFALLNLAWFFAWLLILLALALALKPGFGTFVIALVFLLMIHFSLVLAVEFTAKHEVRHAISTALSKGIRLHHFILPYIIIILSYLIILQSGWVFRLFHNTYGIDTGFFVIISLLFFACARIYFVKVVR